MADRIQIACGKCNKRMAISGKYAGKRIKCPGCGAALAIPAPKASANAERSSTATKRSPAKSKSPAAKSRQPTAPTAKAKPSKPAAPSRRTSGSSSTAKKRKKPAAKKSVETYDDDWLDDDSGFADEGDLYGDDYGDDYGSYDDYDTPALPPKTKKKPKKSAKPKLRGSGNEAPRAARRPTMSFGDRMLSGGGLKGLAMIVGSIVWFVGGLAAGYIFFYPPIMFFIGLFMFGNAVFGSSSYE